MRGIFKQKLIAAFKTIDYESFLVDYHIYVLVCLIISSYFKVKPERLCLIKSSVSLNTFLAS